MEQFNNVLPDTKEENQSVTAVSDKGGNSPLLQKVRQNFGIFSSISLVFGGVFAFCFYKAGLGLNSLLFVLIMVALLILVMYKLEVPIKRVTVTYYAGAILLGLSTMLTASEVLQFLNTIGIMLLLDLSLLHQFHEDDHWDFLKHFGHMVGLVFQGIAAIGIPFIDCFHFFKNTKLIKNDKTKNIMIGIVIAVPLLWAITALLSSADLLYKELTKHINVFLFSPNIINEGFMVFIGFMACYCIICGAVSGTGEVKNFKSVKKGDPTIAFTTMSLLCLIYIVFCGIQLAYLFAGGLFVLPEGFTFAGYARRGFFELLTVTVINIVLMLICTNLFGESKILKKILTVITICTYIMIASAAYRMLLYIGAYNLTFLRLFVLLFLLIDALVLAGVIVSVFNKSFPLFRYCVVVVTVCYLIFSFGKPDYFIAAYHLDHTDVLEESDIAFLTGELSLDAAPVVLPLLSEQESRTKVISNKYKDYDLSLLGNVLVYQSKNYYNRIAVQEENRDIRDFNYSAYLASESAKQYPLK